MKTKNKSMKKNIALVFVSLLLISSIGLASAGWWSNFWSNFNNNAGITGNAIEWTPGATSGECDNGYAMSNYDCMSGDCINAVSRAFCKALPSGVTLGDSVDTASAGLANCPPGYIATGFDCLSSRCENANMKFKCKKILNGALSDYSWLAYTAGQHDCNKGSNYFITGFKCNWPGQEHCGNQLMTVECAAVNYVQPAQVTCTSFIYSVWSACSPSGIQTRTVLSSSPSGCIGGSPVLSQPCTYVPPTQTNITSASISECNINKDCWDAHNQNCYYKCENNKCARFQTVVALSPYPDCTSPVATQTTNTSTSTQSNISSPTSNENITCTDSDGGINYYMQGDFSGSFNGTIFNGSEVCDKGDLQGNTLAEVYCENNELKGAYYTCPNGCFDGACYNESAATTSNETTPAAINGSTTASQSNQTTTSTDNTTASACSSGCSLSTAACVPVGYRTSNSYCNISGKFSGFTPNDASCNNDFECSSNVCAGGKCISQGLLQQILSWFQRFFG